MTAATEALPAPAAADEAPGSGLRVISYGGGVQSTALLVLAGTGHLDTDAALFANVGDDSEHPATLAYVHDIAMPWAEAHDVAVHELHRVRRDGSTETLWGRLTKPGSRSLPIPVRMANTGAPGTRSCTADFKIAVVGRWLRANGASADRPAEVAIGISTDEVERLANRRAARYERPVYPLIDQRLTRADCAAIIRAAGLPVPPKSSCFFCPFHRHQTWAEMRRDTPDLFERASHLEALLIDRRRQLGKDPVYLTRRGRPLADAVTEAQPALFALDGPESCDSGYCWT